MTTPARASTAPTARLATLVGIALQLAMVLVGHVDPAVRALWGLLGTSISLVVGIWAAWRGLTSLGAAVTWGAIAGGVGAFIGIALAVTLGDVPASLLLLGTVGSTVAGVVGAVATYLILGRRA
jgi:hypothetical protein